MGRSASGSWGDYHFLWRWTRRREQEVPQRKVRTE
jgi:hypothetical protein